jgi:colicin import membrane protein
MSTVITSMNPVLSPPPDPDPPILYGYRDIITKRPDGTLEQVRIPLSLEDCLHPEMGDVLVESSLHDLIRMYLANVFIWKTSHDPSSLILSDTGVYWDDPKLKHHCPDVAAIFGIGRRKANYTTFDVAEEKVRPRLIVEIVSPNVRENDVDKKVVQYHLARVPYFVILDKKKEDDPWQLRGYQWSPTHYLDMPMDEFGRLWLEPIGVWLETEGQTVRCRDGATGQIIGDFTQTRQELSEQLARIEVEKARADQERARADAEAQSRLAVEARLREAETELQRLRAQNQG